MSENLQINVEVSYADWESLNIWGTNRDVIGHRIKPGAIIELQLALEFRHLLKYWIANSDQRKEWAIDPKFDAQVAIGLIPSSRDQGKVLQLLRPGTSLTYFEGVVTQTSKVPSKHEPNVEYANALIDCGVPLVLETRLRKGDSIFALGSEGNTILGVCRLFGTITSPGTLFRTPIKAKILSTKKLDTQPSTTLLSVEVAPEDAEPEFKLFYTRLDKKPIVNAP